METTHILERLNGLEAQVKKLQDLTKKLETHLPAAVVAAVVEGLQDAEALESRSRLVTILYHPLSFKELCV